MPAKSITDAFVRNVSLPKPERGERQIAYIDTMERGLALVLVVGYGGSKTFRVMTYRNGKPRTKKLGTYPTMTVKAAREEARAYFENPQRFDAQASIGSFKEVADNWFKRHVEANGLRSQYGAISRCGDDMMRVMLYEAAQSMLFHSTKWSWLKAWAMKIARRRGIKKAIVALARRLAVIMHRIWIDGTEFRWTREVAAA